MSLFAQLLGGLGNQMFIIANLYSLSIDRNMDYCITSFTNSCTKRQEESLWLKTIFKDIKKVSKRPKDVKVRYKERGMKVQKIPNSKGKGLEIYGYFQSPKYFEHNKEKIIELFTKHKKEIQKDLDKKFNMKDKKTISLHIRRADYLQLQHAHVVQTEEYYKKSLEKLCDELKYNYIEELNKEYTFVVFSDDIDWCKNDSILFKSLKNVHYMEKNSAIEDLYMMSMCNHHIIGNSTFSWWASYLNNKENKKVVAPSKWFNPSYKKPEEWQDIYCKNWFII
jgi:hypothetical protein